VKRFVSMIVAGAVVSLVVVAFAPAAARVEVYKVSAALTSNADVPKPKGAALARGAFTGSYVENKTGGVLKWKLTYSRLTGRAVAAHIHKGKVGVAGPVVVPLCGPCHTGQTGTVKISKAVIAALEGHLAYVNVHTAKNAAGEVRGQVKVTG
jgi:CHRD domain-containing protein